MSESALALARLAVSVAGLLLLFGLEAVRPFYRFGGPRARHALKNLAVAFIAFAMVMLVFVEPIRSVAPGDRPPLLMRGFCIQ